MSLTINDFSCFFLAVLCLDSLLFLSVKVHILTTLTYRTIHGVVQACVLQ